jgi:hypothetical protein
MNAYLRIGRLQQPRGNLASTVLLVAAFLILGALAHFAAGPERLHAPTAGQGSTALTSELHGSEHVAPYRLLRKI